jgi:hypothetical protein
MIPFYVLVDLWTFIAVKINLTIVFPNKFLDNGALHRLTYIYHELHRNAVVKLRYLGDPGPALKKDVLVLLVEAANNTTFIPWCSLNRSFWFRN